MKNHKLFVFIVLIFSTFQVLFSQPYNDKAKYKIEKIEIEKQYYVITAMNMKNNFKYIIVSRIVENECVSVFEGETYEFTIENKSSIILIGSFITWIGGDTYLNEMTHGYIKPKELCGLCYSEDTSVTKSCRDSVLEIESFEGISLNFNRKKLDKEIADSIGFMEFTERLRTFRRPFEIFGLTEFPVYNDTDINSFSYWLFNDSLALDNRKFIGEIIYEYNGYYYINGYYENSPNEMFGGWISIIDYFNNKRMLSILRRKIYFPQQ